MDTDVQISQYRGIGCSDTISDTRALSCADENPSKHGIMYFHVESYIGEATIWGHAHITIDTGDVDHENGRALFVGFPRWYLPATTCVVPAAPQINGNLMTHGVRML